MNSKIIRDVHALFASKRLSLSAAESCTGGLIAHYLTALPGSSKFFEAGVITYSVGSKKKILGISDKTISAYGVVSKETAMMMAKKIRALTKTDYSVSTTGNLGPDVLEGKERGLVYISVSSKRETSVKEFRFGGSRISVREKTATAALTFLIEVVTGDQKNIRAY